MGWKKLVLTIVWGAVVAAVAGLTFFRTTDPSVQAWTIGVTVFAVLLEVAFWTTAALLGVTVWESRKAVWRFLTRPFRGKETR